MDIYTPIKPLIDIFTRTQVQTVLIAWLPTKLAPYLTGIIAVDMFMTTGIAYGLSTLAYLIYEFMRYSITGASQNKQITIQIEYYSLGPYNERNKNIIYESLSWLISQQTKKLITGSFTLNIIPNMNNRGNENTIPIINILPLNNQEIIIEYKTNKFNVKYKLPENHNNNINNNNNSYYNYNIISMITQEKPAIHLSTTKKSIDDISELLNDLTCYYFEVKKKTNGRFRYENTDTRWYRIQKLSSCRGLDGIALDEQQEVLLKKELDTFINDKKFYEKIGIPYRRGILLYGQPGTGKTSLINAISSYLARDIYYLNLKMIKNDSELSAVFSTVPSNQLIVLEDVDAQSNILHKRNASTKSANLFNENNIVNRSKNDIIAHFSLSAFLASLDGHIMSEGNIIIMTTNHVKVLDPACIRPGRMDVHLELNYCTRYQIRKLFNSVVNDSVIPEDILKTFPEKLLPPCEVMTTLTLYRKDGVNNIIEKLEALVKKYMKKPHETTKENTSNEIREKKRKLNDRDETGYII